MALPNTGTLSIGDIAAEFGGIEPHSMSEYYGAAAGIPNTGEISVSDFYGASAASFIEATGGTITDVGGYRYHIFTADDDFTIGTPGADADDVIEVAAQAGGGPGGFGNNGNGYRVAGGGGGGCYLETTVAGSDHVGDNPIVVGKAGIPSTTSPISGTATSGLGLSATGGGRGGSDDNMSVNGYEVSGGGGCAIHWGAAGAGGPGGNAGGGADQNHGGGGGGIGSAGGYGRNNLGGVGGNGRQTEIIHGGTTAWSGAGGGGCTYGYSGTPGAGGTGGGGNAAIEPGQPGTTYGSGGGGSNRLNLGGAGYQGVWACRYPYA